MTKDNIEILGILLPFFGSLIGGGIMILLKQRSNKIALKNIEVGIGNLNLSTKKFEDAQYQKLIDISKELTGNTYALKVKFHSELYAIVRDIERGAPPSITVEDDEEMNEYIAKHICINLNKYNQQINQLMESNPLAFPAYIDELENTSTNIKNLLTALDIKSGYNSDLDEAFDSRFDDLLDIYHVLKAISNNIFNEFKALEQNLKDFLSKNKKQ